MRIRSTEGIEMRARKSGLQPLALVFSLAVLGAALWVLLQRTGWLRTESVEAERGAPVQRGPLRISVVERGNLKAADSVSLKSEIEGQTTILYLVPEGTMVEEGTLVCELDATEQIDQRFQQEISVRNAEAAHVKSKQNYEIQQSQNDSDIKKAEQQLFFADTDLRKFQEGEKRAQEAEADEQIKLAEEEATRAGEKLDWSQKLFDKGFLTNTELEADRLSLSRAQIQLEQARRDMDLLVRFQLPRDEADLLAKLEEARRELGRVKLQAAARIVDYEADMQTNAAKLSLEKEKLAKLENQIAKAKLHAPRAGMVVYAQEEGGRYGMSQPIKEGTQVRERQEVITIPSAAGMIAQVSLHESVLEQIQAGQSATIRVDALPDREFNGRVRYVAVLPDQNSWFANPNTRLYRTEVAIDNASGEMRPGMSCAIDILVEEIPDALFVPVQAVFRAGSENLAFVERSGDVEERTVQVGRYNDRWVQVLAGLGEGEIVLLAPPPDFMPQGEAQGVEEGAAPGAPAGPAGRTAAPAATAARPERPAGEGQGDRDGARGREGGEDLRQRFSQMSEEERAKLGEQFRQRLGEMSEEERARMQEQFRERRGSDGERPRGGDESRSGG